MSRRPEAPGPQTTVDAFLGGRIEAMQPADGHHRSGLEAVLLAAALPAETSGTVIDLGAGAGVAGMCAAARCPAAGIVLVEREAFLLECARTSLARPANRGFAGRVSLVAADISPSTKEEELAALRETADELLINPPFYDAVANSASPKAARAGAHVLAEAGLDPWLRTAATMLKSRGRVTVIFRADGLDLLLAAFARRFGKVDVLPIHPRAHLPAHRVLVAGRKGSRAALRLLPPLVLHPKTGNAFLPPVEAMLRGGAGLGTVHEAWQERR
jgi:tRNA1(Val) A37 N6-methylase TrmN6